jgi:DNA modification methylase
VVVDLTASTGTSLHACCASGHLFFGLESDSKIFDSLLKPMLKPEEQPPIFKRNKVSIPTRMD